jgi:23S rRNA (guanine2445-N2)-methyltransferase / 23S rRNA (guanine2069-N7)-methyltransferase
MFRHYDRWARRSGVSCFRVYDADLPDYAVAIDVYNGAGPDAGSRWAHVAEYAPPADVDPARAQARMKDVEEIVPEALGVDPQDMFVKQRRRQRGTEQYQRIGREGARGIVEEGGLLFEVNFSDYLDTGLFLDHRLTRHMLREMADGARFLNLFAYTASASVYAAAGGALSTTSVDMSAGYLDWAGRNMELNGFGGSAHERIRADVLSWLSAPSTADERYNLVFLDPPAFSNSKRMNAAFDVQRDHVELIGRSYSRRIGADSRWTSMRLARPG